MRYYGLHVSAAGGLENAIRNGRALGVNTIQIHPSPPQRWNSKPFVADHEKVYLAEQRGSGIEHVFFHAIYLINLATPDPQKFHLSKISLLHDLELIERIKGSGVIFHVGSLKDEPDENVGFQRAAEGISWILSKCEGSSRLILEVSAGSGNVIGDRVEELARIFERLSPEHQERVGFGLDSQHMWASGYDFQNHLEEIIDEVESTYGFDKVWAVHLNDSMSDLGSRKDRHDNLGEGKIGEKALTLLLNHPKLIHIPFILETPAIKEFDGAVREVEKLRRMLGLAPP